MSGLFSSPAVTDDYVVVGSRDGGLYCLNPENGEVLWVFQTQGDVDSSPVIAGDRVIFGSLDGRLYIVDLREGEEIWSYEIGDGIVASPAVAVICTVEEAAFGLKLIPVPAVTCQPVNS